MDNQPFESTNDSIFIPAVYNPATGKVLIKSPEDDDQFVSVESFKGLVSGQKAEVNASQTYTECKVRINNKTGEVEYYDCKVVKQ